MYEFNSKLFLYQLGQLKLNTVNKYQKGIGTIEYYNVECAFDIETTSTTQGEQKVAFMYEWTFGIKDIVVYGRTWDSFLELISILKKQLKLSEKRILLCYVHNLSYEFQFMRKYFTWVNVFSLSERKPIKALTDTGIEFRCSYVLSGLSLATTAKNLVSHNLKKLYGDLDYSLIRHSETPLTKDELKYCEYDVLIVLAYINEQIAEYGDNITAIPLTNTGRVRQYVKKNCFSGNKSKGKHSRYSELMQELTITENEYRLLKMAFQGGFTHANYLRVGDTIENVHSIDFTSSYPAVMLSEKFPMSKAKYYENVSHETMLRNFKKKNYCYICLVKITGINSIYHEMYLSEHKCYRAKGVRANNGRIESAKELYTAITNVDYQILQRVYTWESIEFIQVYEYFLDYLPQPIIKSIIELYQKKTELKGVAGSEQEYLKSKGMLNSVYGMCVTDIVRDDILYDNDWSTSKADFSEKIKQYNESKNRFLFFPWGIFVTAYSRRNLWSGILSMQDDYIYSDTDSIKFTNYNNHTWYIEKYNAMITTKIHRMCDFYKIPYSAVTPKTIKGVEKPIGVWDYEGMYSKFKTLGAKRYMYVEDGKLHITIAGLSKQNGADYLFESNGGDLDKVFDSFNNQLYIPPSNTGKSTHTYIDEPLELMVTDYTGIQHHVTTLSGVHLGECEFTLSISKQYGEFLRHFMAGYCIIGDKYI